MHCVIDKIYSATIFLYWNKIWLKEGGFEPEGFNWKYQEALVELQDY